MHFCFFVLILCKIRYMLYNVWCTDSFVLGWLYVKAIQWTGVSYMCTGFGWLIHEQTIWFRCLTGWGAGRPARERTAGHCPAGKGQGLSFIIRSIYTYVSNPQSKLTVFYIFLRLKQWPSPWEQTSVIVVPWMRTSLSLVLPFPLMLKTFFISRRWGLKRKCVSSYITIKYTAKKVILQIF